MNGIIALTAINRVISSLPEDQIIPGATKEAIVAIPTPQGVVSSTTVDVIISVATKEALTSTTAVDVIIVCRSSYPAINAGVPADGCPCADQTRQVERCHRSSVACDRYVDRHLAIVPHDGGAAVGGHLDLVVAVNLRRNARHN